MIQNRQARTKKSLGLVKSESNVESQSVSQDAKVYQVSQLTRDIKAIMEAAFGVPHRVEQRVPQHASLRPCMRPAGESLTFGASTKPPR